MIRSTKRPGTLLLSVCCFLFAAGLSTAAFAACTPQTISNCQRMQRNCELAGGTPVMCERAYLGCMARAGCEVP